MFSDDARGLKRTFVFPASLLDKEKLGKLGEKERYC